MNLLTKEIKKLIREDQKDIHLYGLNKISKKEWLKNSSARSSLFLDLLNKYGFPYCDIYPKEIYTDVITLSLHLELKDMIFVYNKYIKDTPGVKVLNKHKIIFIDKILILSKKKQLYGTQYKIPKNGKVKLLPVKDENNLNKRRRELGVETIEEYIKEICK